MTQLIAFFLIIMMFRAAKRDLHLKLVLIFKTYESKNHASLGKRGFSSKLNTIFFIFVDILIGF